MTGKLEGCTSGWTDLSPDPLRAFTEKGLLYPLRIDQDATLFGAVLILFRPIWMASDCSREELGGKELEARDGAAVSDETVLNIRAKESSVFLLCDLA